MKRIHRILRRTCQKKKFASPHTLKESSIGQVMAAVIITTEKEKLILPL
jgi:hypothetical protein